MTLGSGGGAGKLMNLMVSALRARRMSHAAGRRGAGAGDVAGFAPSEAQQARRDAARKILIES